MTRLSVIVPCYNCARTLDDAVESIYRQDVRIPFDVTMVDDGSTDGTYGVMTRLAAKHTNIRLLHNPTNQGGGAARNMGVTNSSGDLILCVDADDMLGPGFLNTIVEFWLRKRCDGVGMSTSIKFRRSNIHDVAYVTEFEGPGQKVPFESFLGAGACSLNVVFLMTRRAFLAVGGYPTAHGFDTQGMGFRFLCNGLSAYTCPGTVYYHRVDFHESYYLREYAKGLVSWNWLQILSEFLYLFRREIKAQILDYDLFTTQTSPTLEQFLRERQKVRSIYAPDYRKLIGLGRDRMAAELRHSKDKYDQYWLGDYALSRGKERAAFDRFAAALKSGFNHWIIYGKLVEASLRLSDSRTPVGLTMRGARLSWNDGAGTLVEPLAPRPSLYQRFENWLFRQRRLNGFARLLKASRLYVRRLRHGARRWVRIPSAPGDSDAQVRAEAHVSR